MGRRNWYNDLARNTRDLSYLARVYAPKTKEEAKKRQGCATALLIVFAVIIGLIISLFINADHDVKENAPANTATAIAAINSKAVSATPYPTNVPVTSEPTATESAIRGAVAEVQEPTEIVIPTINPDLLIRYEDDGQCLIKGNINSKGVKIYHLPGSSAYNSTKIDTKAGERWFCTEYDAIRAGWHAPGQ